MGKLDGRPVFDPNEKEIPNDILADADEVSNVIKNDTSAENTKRPENEECLTLVQ